MTAKTPAALGSEFAAVYASGQPLGAITPGRVQPISQDLIDLLAAGAGVWLTGAAGNGVTDDTAAFQAAIASVPPQGCLWVPMPASSYLISGTLTLNDIGMSGMGGCVPITFAGGSTSDCIEAYGPTAGGTRTMVVQGFFITGGGAKAGRDGVRHGGGVGIQFRDLVIFNMGRDGFHSEAYQAYSYSEQLMCLNIACNGNGRDNFHFETGNTGNVDYINQTKLIGCASRAPGRYSLALVNNSTLGANSKISDFSWDGGELDCTGGSAPDNVYLQNTSSGGVIEGTAFDNVAIEDVGVTHSGYAIGTSNSAGSSIQAPWIKPTVIYYGQAHEGVNPAGLTGGVANPVGAAVANDFPGGQKQLTAIGMFGWGFFFTPTYSGRTIAILGSQVFNYTGSEAQTVTLQYGSGSAPANGAAVQGTQAGGAFGTPQGQGGSIEIGAHFAALVSLTVGTTYWFDLACTALSGGTAVTIGASFSAIEL